MLNYEVKYFTSLNYTNTQSYTKKNKFEIVKQSTV